MRNVCWKATVLALTVVGLTGLASRIEAQTIQNLIQFNSNWMYDQTGRDLGTAWRAPTYVPDAQWQGPGAGLLGFEPDTPAVYTAHAPISTPLTISSTITTYYFRATFNFAGTTNGMSLIATNLVDDGCALYLNGTFVGGVRAPGTYNAATFFTGPTTEGQLDVVNITALAALRQGQNVMAVEVHQSGAASSDVMFGMRLMAFIPSALSITSQPQSQALTVGDPLSLSVGVSGGPVAYRWFKDGTFISNATNATYSVPSVTANNAGSYRVVVSNIVNVLTSAVATVTIASDTEGPHMLAAVIANVTGAGTFATNTINVLWDEPLTSASAQNTNNYKLVMSTNSNIRIPVTRAIYSSALGTLLTVDSTNAYWSATGEYYLIVNNVADNHGNNINPNSVIGVSLLLTSNLVQMSDQWSFYDCDDVNFCDPDSDAVYANEAWTKTNYVVTPLWGTGFGIFVHAPGNPTNLCAGDQRATTPSWQPDPTLFRKTFMLPTNASPNAKVKLRFTYDDGLVVYLNGRSIYTNSQANGTPGVTPGPITKASRATAETTTELCNTNTPFLDVNNLLPGTNWIAAAVVQVSPGGGIDPGLDSVFGLEMDLLTTRTARAPTNFPPGTPTLARSVVRSPQTNFFVLSWPETNYGYALMYSTDIADYGYAYRNGAPISGNPGPNPARRWYTNAPLWLQVSNQANPFTNPIPTGATGPRRFYKLFREKLND